MSNEVPEVVEVGSLETADLKQKIDDLLNALRSNAKVALSNLSEYRYKPFIVKSNDVREIFEKIRQEISFLTIYEEEVELNIRYKNGSTAEFTTIEEFSKHEAAVSESLSELVLSYDVKGKRSGSDDMERFIMWVALRAEIPSYEYRSKIVFHDSELHNIRWTISFTNFVMAKNISKTISDWSDGLPELDRKTIIEKMINPLFINTAHTFFVSMASLSTSVFLYTVYKMQRINSLEDLSYWLFVSAILWFLLRVCFRWMDGYFEKNIMYSCFVAGFDITSGDKKRIENLKKEKEVSWGNIKKILFATIVAVPLQILMAKMVVFIGDVLAG